MRDSNDLEPLREIGGLTWENVSSLHSGREAWQWHTDDELDWSEGIEPIADDVTGISVAFCEGGDGSWSILLSLDEDGSRRNYGLTEEEARTRAVRLAKAIRYAWDTAT